VRRVLFDEDVPRQLRRDQLLPHGARFRIVKNTLTRRAAEQAGADALLARLEKFDIKDNMAELLDVTNSFLGTYMLLPAFKKLSNATQAPAARAAIKAIPTIASTRRPGPGIRAWGTSFGEIPESEFGSIRGRLRKNETISPAVPSAGLLCEG